MPDEPFVKPKHETIEAFGRTCLKHPEEIKATSWHRFTVALITAGQPRAYADSVYQANICFEGGGHTTKAGIDSPFFTNPPESRVRQLAYWVTGATADPGAFGTRLTECRMIQAGETYSIWRVTAVTPFTD